MRRRFTLLSCLALLWAGANPAFADWIVFRSGGAMEVAKIERVGPNLRLTRTDGVGWVTAPPDRIDWEASTARSGHPVGPDPPVSGNGGASQPTQTPPGRRTRAGKPMPSADTNSYWAFAVRVKTAPKVDGVLDDEAWKQALPFGGLYLQETHEGESATEDTEIRIVYDDKAIYFGIRAYDREPKKIIARNMLRSATLRTDDSFRILVDSLHDHETAYSFGTNPNGMLVDAIEFGKENQDTNWNGIWWTHGTIDDRGWSTEVAVPFKTLKFPRSPEHTWGVTISRRIARRNEFSYWPFIPNNSTFYWAGSCGHIEGIDDVKPGSDFQIKPYVAGGLAKNYQVSSTDRQFDAGFDFKYSFTPFLAADFTYRTDFAQTEVDDVQVNLTRFPLYYTEKRQYFLDGAKIFDFGLKKEAEIYYSRRIGLSEAGTQVPILAGARVTGKAGKYYIGALNIQTQRTQPQGTGVAVPSTNWTVLRVSRDVGPRSRVGAIFTNRGPSGSSVTDNRVVGVDGLFYVGNAISVDGFAAAAFDPSIKDKRMAGRAAFAYVSDKYGFNASYLDVGDNFRPGAGFVSRAGVRRTSLSGRYSPRPRVWGLRRMFFEPALNYFTTQTNVPQTRNRNLTVRGEFESGETATFAMGNDLENLFKPFAIRKDVVIPAGTYTFTDATVGLSTYPARPINGSVNVTIGQFYNGKRKSVSLSGMWRINKYFNLTPGYSRDRINLPGHAFTTHVVKTRFNLNFSSLMSIDGLLQWSNDGRALVTNIRFNWIYKPGTDFYLVYTEVDDTMGLFRPKNRTLIAKINYVLDF
jgi:hypothetical protein